MAFNKSNARKLAEFLRNITDDAKIETDAVEQNDVVTSRTDLEAKASDTTSIVTPAAVTSFVTNKLGDYVRSTHDIPLTFTGDVTGSGTITDMGATSFNLTLDAETLPSQSGHSGKFLTTNGTAASWTALNTSNWNTAYGWGNHADEGYLTSFTESDPTVPSHVKSITTTNISNWNTAYGWGDHSQAGYLTSETNDYVDSISFSGGTLRLGRTGTLADLTVNLDGRYLQSYTETDTLASVCARGNTSPHNILITKNDPRIILNDTNGNPASYPAIEFNTSNNQGLELYHTEFDSELTLSGYGLVVGPSTDNTQHPTTGDISFNVLGEIYAGSETLGSLNKVWHAGNLNPSDYLLTSNYEDNYVDSVSFSTTTGVLTLGRTGSLPNLSVDLDGKYAESNHVHSQYMLKYNGASTADYDTLLTNGIWRNQGGANGPEGTTHSTGLVALQDNGTYGFQLFSDTVTNTNPDMYFRNKDTIWGSWNKLWHSNNLNPVTGLTHDTVNTELDVTFADGTTQSLDLSQYIDDTNLSRIVSGSHVGSGIVRFTRDDSTTFDVDFSDFFDDTNLARITSASWNTANGVLTLTRNDSSTVTVDLDGRYYNTTESDSRYVRQLSLTTSPDYQTPSSRRVDPNSSNPTNEHYAVMTYGNGGNVTGQLATHFQHGATYNRAYNNSWSAWSRMFDDDYHPNADRWTTARTITLAGDLTGSVSIDGSANVTLSGQVVNDSHTHDGRYYTESEADNRFVNVTGDTMTGNLTIQNTTPSLILVDTESSSPNNQSIRIQHDAIDNQLPTGEGLGLRIDTTDTSGANLNPCVITSGQLYAENNQKVFHNSYHPNADKWTTARTHTVTLTGDVSGSASQSVDGTGNKTWTINTVVGTNSHHHTRLSGFSNQTEYDLIRAGNANGLCFKARWDGTTSNRYWDMGYVDGFGTFYSGLKVYSGGNLEYKGNRVWDDGYHPVAWADISGKPPIDNSVDYINSASFNTSNGVLTLSGVGRAGATVDLDNRYLTSYSETDTLHSVTARGNSTSNKIILSNTGTIGSSVSTMGNAPLLVGSTSNGVGIDNNEIMASGGHFYIGTASGNSHDVVFRRGGSDRLTLNSSGAAIDGNLSVTGNITGTVSASAIPEFLEEKHIFTSNDSNAVYMPMVKGGLYGTGNSTISGFIKIKSGMMANTNSMMSMTVDIYEYTTGESCSFRISGYAHSSGWINCSVVNLTDKNQDYTVRFVKDTDNNHYVAIGETTSTWTYPQVIVRDVLGGYSTSEGEAQREFFVTFQTSLTGTVNHAFNNNQPYGHWDRLEAKPSTFPPSSHNHDDRYVNVSGDTMTGSLTVPGVLKITETGTAQHLLIGNQDSGGANKPAMVRGVNGQLQLGHGSSWSGEGGTMTVGLTVSGANVTIGGSINDSNRSSYYWLPDPQGTGTYSSHRFGTNHGYIDIGPKNTTYSHIDTDRPKFYFNKRILVDEGIVSSFNEDLYLRRAESSDDQIHISTTTTTISQNTVIQGNLTVNGSIAQADGFGTLYTFSPTMALSTSWADIPAISGNALATGTYAVQIYVYNSDASPSGGNYLEYYSGIMSWYASGTNDNDSNEIPLHNAGHAYNGPAIYLRTLRRSSSTMILQIAASGSVGSDNFTIKFRRLI